jgi:hypothetical protein
LLDGGTALVTDVGTTGPVGGPAGLEAHRFVARLRGMPEDELPSPRPASGPIALGAVRLDIECGRTRHAERLSHAGAVGDPRSGAVASDKLAVQRDGPVPGQRFATRGGAMRVCDRCDRGS